MQRNVNSIGRMKKSLKVRFANEEIRKTKMMIRIAKIDSRVSVRLCSCLLNRFGFEMTKMLLLSLSSRFNWKLERIWRDRWRRQQERRRRCRRRKTAIWRRCRRSERLRARRRGRTRAETIGRVEFRPGWSIRRETSRPSGRSGWRGCRVRGLEVRTVPNSWESSKLGVRRSWRGRRRCSWERSCWSASRMRTSCNREFWIRCLKRHWFQTN